MPRDIAVIARHTCVLLVRDPGTLIAYAVMSSTLMAVLHPVYQRMAGPGVSGATSAAAGTAVMFTLLALDVAGEQILAERDWHTWDRLRATPARPVSVLTGKALPLVTVFLALQALLFAEADWWYGLDLTAGTWRLPLLWLAWASCATALGLALGAWLNSRGRLGAIADITAMITTGLSGALVPLAGLPRWIGDLAPALPAYWAVRGFQAALGGRPAGVYTRAVLAITAITVIAGALAALGALRRTHRTA
ncbi:ABC transporter permease [Actinoallomurus sp. CA-150999]|uniref:ABC transporter permease n=1 Tax=Actinoallomurus sp. CA-150999 TaxID=3239887 RepID=UPI003D8BBC32